jgi:pimeloyl-ACP methyl ester carboxylesterase
VASSDSIQPISIERQANGLRFRILHWPGDQDRLAFLLLHGLASNARFWEPVAGRLAAVGHAAYAPDLRGHGQSDAPPGGYDFETVTQDVAGLISELRLTRFVIAGHSWGGHVALDVAAHHPPAGLALIDGGFTQLRDAPRARWEEVERALTPPRLAGTPLAAFRDRLEAAHPDWLPDVPWQEIVLANFEIRQDGTIAPHLSFENHMQVVRALWEFPTYDRFADVSCPVLIAAARANGPLPRREEGFLELKRRGEKQALGRMGRVRFIWMDGADHDIPLHRPQALTALLLDLASQAEAER